MGNRIVQLVAATSGFYVRHEQPEGTFFTPVAAWALMEDGDGERWIEAVNPVGRGWDGLPSSSDDIVHVTGAPGEAEWPPRSDLDRALAEHTQAMTLQVKMLDEHKSAMTGLISALDEHARAVQRSL